MDNLEERGPEILVDWLKELRYVDESKVNVRGAEGTGHGSQLHVELYTGTHTYKLTARFDVDGPGYLGCIARTNRARQGEDWLRGNDLPDGPLTRDTFNSIIGAIVGYELEQVESQLGLAPHHRGIAGTPVEATGEALPT